MDISATLPPVGLIGPGDHSQVTMHLENLAKEASEAAADPVDKAESNLKIYIHGSDPEPSSCDVVSNQIGDACDAITDFQTRDAPIRNIDPIERGEPGEVYYFTPDGQITGPMPPEQAQAMMQPTLGMDGMGQPVQQPSPYNPANFVTIDDKSTAEFFQKQLDVYWMRGQLDKSCRLAIHYGNIFGYMFPVYEWDMDYHRPRLWTDISIRDTYVDPTRACIEDSAYAGVDWWIDAQQAKTMFPHLADIIEERARTGTPDRPGSTTQLSFNINRVFRRNTIILRVFWLRNQPCPFEVNEALAAGLLERRMIPVGDPTAVIPDEMAQFPKGAQDDELQSQIPDDAEQEANQSTATESQSSVGGDGGMGISADPASMVGQDQPQREALFHNGTEVTPPQPGEINPNWPMYRCTRQVTAVLGLVVDDRECEYFDIPMLQFLSKPIPYQPFGQGIPERLRSMQDGRIVMLTGIKDHTDLMAHPVAVIPQSAWGRLDDRFKNEGASRAGMTIIPDDEVYKALNGKIEVFIEPPPMSQSLVDGERIFHDELAERSGNPDVLQGKPPAGVTGWQSIQLLSQNASTRFGFSLQWSRDMYTRLVKLVLHDLINPKKVTPQDLRAVDSRYPLAIVDAFQKRGAMIEWDCSVDVQTGVGGSRNKKQAEAQAAHDIVDPLTGDPVVSTETLTDTLGYDYQQEQERNSRARQQAMQQQAQTMQMQAAMNPQPQKPANGAAKSTNGSSNGNGRMNFNGGQ